MYPRRLPLLFVAVLAVSGGKQVHARVGGIATEGCEGCHQGGKPTTVTISADPMSPMPGTMTTITVRVPRTNGPAGGFYLSSNGLGAFAVIAGQGTRVEGRTGVVHSAVKRVSSGDITWQMRWTAPATKGSVDLDAYVLSANGDNRGGGDGEGYTRLSLTYGCEGVAGWIDRDRDGFGGETPTRVCELGPGVATKSGDCNDFEKNSYPGGTEICDSYDNNCNGTVNEGLGAEVLYRDADGDGHGARNTTDIKTGCVSASGYVASRDDCDDNNKSVHPGQAEMCDGMDNDCNGRVDDGARAYCGTGWCRRQSPTCDAKACVPGQPRVEQCNAFDDDCDGVIDNGADKLCDVGKSCVGGYCVGAAELMNVPGRDAGAEAGASTGGGTQPGGGGDDDDDPEIRRGGGCTFGGTGASGPVLLLVAAVLLTRRRR